MTSDSKNHLHNNLFVLKRGSGIFTYRRPVIASGVCRGHCLYPSLVYQLRGLVAELIFSCIFSWRECWDWWSISLQGCSDLTNAKHYHRRHKVCQFHSKATSVVTSGVQQRFCQQCRRFHLLAEFDEVKRSCKKCLVDHNSRRRKPQTNTIVPAVSSAEAATALKVEDDDNNVSGSCNNTSRGQICFLLPWIH